MSGLVAVGYFLFSIVFNFLIFILWARIALRYFRVSTLHPMSHIILRFTNPIVAPLARFFRTTKSYPKRYDWACFIVLIITELIKFTLIGLLLIGKILPWLLIVLYILADLIIQPCDLLFYAILIRVIMSWVNPHWQHPIADFLRMITEPLLRIARRIVPDVMGLDFSPILVIIALKVIILFINASLPLHLL